MAINQKRETVAIGSRNSKGSSLMEFGLIFFILFFIFAVPGINAVIFVYSYSTAQLLVSETVSRAAMAETRKEAVNTSKDALAKLKSPLWSSTVIQPVKDERIKNIELNIVLTSTTGHGTKYDATKRLPEIAQPRTGENISKLEYSYELKVRTQIRPFLSLCSIPGINQIPVIGAPIDASFVAHAPIEHLRSLNY